jgi:16S rRNA (uracil1498-N3)-methyltransferase
LEYLSDIELYITSSYSEADSLFEITDEEYHHAIKVMRNKIGDRVYATNGGGQIFEGKINEITKANLAAEIVKTVSFINEFKNFTLCIPNLKNPERLKFVLEKSIELGFTNFIIFNSERTIGKKINKARLEKISLSAMKQSLHSYIPQITTMETLNELEKLNRKIILFDQSSRNKMKDFNFDMNKNYLLMYGPEGSFSKNEIKQINPDFILNLGKQRLRSETAIIKCASIISDKLQND